MFWKVLVAVILAHRRGAFLTQSAGVTVATFLIALIVVLIIEGVRVVPQQKAWVVERLGKFHAILRAGPQRHRARSSTASPTGTRSRKCRSTCPSRSASPRTTPSSRWTGSSTSR